MERPDAPSGPNSGPSSAPAPAAHPGGSPADGSGDSSDGRALARRRTVVVGTPGQGAELAVFEYGRQPGPGVPTLVLVHGYPDDHRVYLPVIALLAATHHLVAVDTRNAGQSVAVSGDYRISVLVDDLFAVLDAVAVPGVHLVGHDWGSIQGWAAVADPRSEGRIARFTSISGPDLGHFRRWTRSRLRTPGRWPELAGQLLRSWYIGAFQLPVLPEIFWQVALRRRYERSARRRVGADPLRGLALYRALRSPSGLGPRLPAVTVPVHVVVPVKDPFLSPALIEGLGEWVEDLRVTRVDAGHWWPETRPADFADLLRREP
ncbi:MAG: Oxidoreductase, short-chain dehydrogenase/reductase family [uncultured Arthrobacter sp.]|uniref:Oxidoreductase, short-chain dehydrogenase/reductase family n=1 Tax=uncultured Arthrobacter sp. TaxID=114050 RepID=A0A6J4HYK2_9MICC|nr:alpha/beta fold hydrolase [uncultured Arthrobacter sp.]CAA9236501.1 MAG: Oxidoreductase, short-chain dehydrogenase/reductase family [uncultured Arthrobacter sp.]